jgi:hypothetical protein
LIVELNLPFSLRQALKQRASFELTLPSENLTVGIA